MKIRKMVMAFAAMSAAVAMEAGAMTTPIEISLFCAPLSLPWCDDVSGLRLDLLSGMNRNVSGLDIGTLVNIADKRATGLELCGFYNRVGEGAGLFQVAGLLNRCDADYKGVQVAGLYNEVGGSMSGAAIAAMNMSKSLQGLQFGLFNTTETLVGMQLGIVNYAENSDKGVQVGLVNVMPDGNIPVSTIVNIGF